MLMPSGTGSQSSALELPSCAKAPSRCRLIMRSPSLKRVTASPTATTSPAPSFPGTKGGSGRNWYLPASIRTSTYCTPRAAIRTCTSPGPGGGGSGTSRSTRTSGPPNASQTTAFIALSSAPIVENVEAGSAVAGLIRPMHRHALDPGTKPASQHMPVRLLARQIDPRQHVLHADRLRESGATVEQRRETLLAARARPYRTELDKAATLAGLACRPPMADREAGEAAVALP